MILYRGNIKDGQFDYKKYYPVSLDGKQILDRAIPNGCYAVEKTEIPEGKLLDGIIDNVLCFKDDLTVLQKIEQEQLLKELTRIYEEQDPFLQAQFQAAREIFVKHIEAGEYDKAKAILTSPHIPAEVQPIVDALLKEFNK